MGLEITQEFVCDVCGGRKWAGGKEAVTYAVHDQVLWYNLPHDWSLVKGKMVCPKHTVYVDDEAILEALDGAQARPRTLANPD